MSISAFAVRRRGEAGNWNFAGHGNSTRRNDHEIHADSKGHQRFRSRQDAQRGNDQRDGEVQPGPGQSGGSGRCGGSIPQLQRRARPNLRQRKENGDRWTIRRIEGVGRRLLAYQGEFARRSDRVGQAISSYAGPGHRNRSARVYRVRITFAGCSTARRLVHGSLALRLSVLAKKRKRPGSLRPAFKSQNWLRGLDLNQRPPGYEPDELPGCSTPQKHHSGCGECGQTLASFSRNFYLLKIEKYSAATAHERP